MSRADAAAALLFGSVAAGALLIVLHHDLSRVERVVRSLERDARSSEAELQGIKQLTTESRVHLDAYKATVQR